MISLFLDSDKLLYKIYYECPPWTYVPVDGVKISIVLRVYCVRSLWWIGSICHQYSECVIAFAFIPRPGPSP